MTINEQDRFNNFIEEGECYEPKEQFYQWLLDSTQIKEKLESVDKLWQCTQANASAETYAKLTRFLATVEAKDIKVMPKPNRWRKPILIASSIAATILILIVSINRLGISSPDPIEYGLNETVASFGEIEKITLADGTRVTLNSGSSIFYPQEFNGSKRIVYLVGEAFFEVAKDESKPFLVKSNNQEVTVLGTKFNINSYPDISEIKTTLLEGSVAVKYSNKDDMYILEPGEQIYYSKTEGNITVNEVDTDDELLWMKGRIKLKDVTIGEILAAMEKRYNVSFQYNSTNLKQDKYNITFRAETDLEAALSIVNHLVGPFTYKMINPQSCQIKFY